MVLHRVAHVTGIYFTDSLGIYREMEQAEVDRVTRKPQVWGPYCTLQRTGGYIHTVYPSRSAIIQDDNGDLREATDEELDAIAARNSRALEQSFRQTSREMRENLDKRAAAIFNEAFKP